MKCHKQLQEQEQEHLHHYAIVPEHANFRLSDSFTINASHLENITARFLSHFLLKNLSLKLWSQVIELYT